MLQTWFSCVTNVFHQTQVYNLARSKAENYNCPPSLVSFLSQSFPPRKTDLYYVCENWGGVSNRMSLYIASEDFNLFSSDHRIINPAGRVIHLPSGKPQARICLGRKWFFLANLPHRPVLWSGEWSEGLPSSAATQPCSLVRLVLGFLR